MPDINCTFDGFEWRNALSSQDRIWRWADKSNTASGTDATPNQIYAGTFGNRRDYKAVMKYGPINLARGTSIAFFNLRITPTNVFKDVNLVIRAVKNSKINIGLNALPSDQVLTTAFLERSLAQYPGFNPNTEWLPSQGNIVIGVAHIMQEVINQSTWTSGDSVTFILDYNYVAGSSGRLQWRATEHPQGSSSNAGLTTTADNAGPIAITSVNTNNVIRSGDTNIKIIGTGFVGSTELRIYKGSRSEKQLITYKQPTELRFNYNGTLPVGTGYTLELIVDQEVRNFTIAIAEGQVAGLPAAEVIIKATKDSFEWANKADGFPGTFADVSNTASQTDGFPFRVFVGQFKSPPKIYQCVLKFGPLGIPKGAKLEYFDLMLYCARMYRHVEMVIRAVSNAAAADVSVSNLISSQNLTTAFRIEKTASWSNSSATDFWLQSDNPKAVDVKNIVDEMINTASWSESSSIQFVIKFNDLGAVQGFMSVWATESTYGLQNTIRYKFLQEPLILSVSSDNVIEKGELDVTIIGQNLAGATNLLIAKGGISEPQVIKSSSNINIVFDLNTGAIVSDTGYTLSFVKNGKTYTQLINIVEGGGINVGDVDVTADYIERSSNLPVVNGTVYQSSTNDPNLSVYSDNLLFVGQWGAPLYHYKSVMTIGPISAVRGQTFSTCELVLRPGQDLDTRAYKYVNLFIRAYKGAEPALTTAVVNINTADWAGSNATARWTPPEAITVDVTTLVEEVVATLGWLSGNSVTFDVTYQLLGGTDGYVSFYAEENALRGSSLSYITESATNIANVNGNNVIRHNQSVEINGSALDNATGLTVKIGNFFSNQVIKSNTSTKITFDYVRGSNGYGPATVVISFAATTVTLSVNLQPEINWSYVVVIAPTDGDDGLAFSADPAFKAGDIIAYEKSSRNGFAVTIDAKTVPIISGGQGANSFKVQAWDSFTGIWSDVETVNFNAAGYLVRNQIQAKVFETYPLDDGDVTVRRSLNERALEEWRKKVGPTETWTKK